MTASLPSTAAVAARVAAATVDNLLEGCQVIAPDFRYLYVNDAVVKQARSTREQLLGRTMMEVFPGIDDTPMFALLRECMRERAPRQMLNAFDFPDGSRGWFELRLEPVPDGVAILSVDVTAQQRAEAELRRKQRALVTLSDCNQTLVRATDEGRFMADVCRIAVEKGGYRMAWIGLKQPDAERPVRLVASAGLDAGALERARATWNDVERGRGPTGRAMRTGEVVVARFPASDVDTTSGAASAIALPIVVEGESIGALTIYAGEPEAFDDAETELLREMAMDLGYGIETLRARGERRRAQAALERLAAELEERVATRTRELERTRAEVEDLYDHAPVGYHSLDAERRFVRVNATEASWLGYAKEELLGRPITDFLDEESKARVAERFPRFLASGTLGAGLEVTFVRRDGTPLPALVNASVIRDAQGNVTATRSTLTDMTERRQLEHELLAARNAADAANRAKSAFLANMSHEIRTPMNAVLGFAQLMLRDPATTVAQRQHLETISRAGDHLLGLIDGILQFARIESGRVALVESTFDLGALLGDKERLFRERASAKGLRLLFEGAEAVPRFIVADEGKLRQILSNLLANAVKFTEHGGVAARVAVRERDQARRLVVEVEDTGPGIAADEMANLFKKFEQTESGRRSRQGTGLGLAISRELARLMGGDVTVASRRGEGSVFRLELPLVEGAAVDVTPKVAEPRVKRLRPGQPAYRVLVVDDKADNRAFASALLAAVGFETREAQGGAEALHVFEEWRPHLVLMDMRMPVVDGAEAIRRIRATERGGEVKIVSLTASAFEEDRQEARAVGADEFLSKPFREGALFEKVKALLAVEYEYEGDEVVAAGVTTTEEAPLTAARVRELPAALRARLEQATLIADVDGVLALVGEVGAHDAAVAERIEELCRRFAYRQILDLLGEDSV